MLDLSHTLQYFQAWNVSLIAQTGLMAALAEFVRDLVRKRVRSDIAAARKRGVAFGRRPGQRVKSDRLAPKGLQLVGVSRSYREICQRLGFSKNTLLGIVKRDRAA